jgi:hypothetical protein
MFIHTPMSFLGQGNTGSPTKLPHYYNVLGWFHVTDIWCERFNELNCWMVRLEKVDLTEKSWWSRADTPHSPPDFDSPKALVRTCNSCGKESKMIYKQGWACLNADPEPTKKGNKTREKKTCTEFFKFGEGINITNLEYTEEFLKERSSFKVLREQVNLDPNPGPLGPPLLTEDDVERLGEFGFEEECKRGIVCPKCGCCSRRVNWGKWVCESSTSGGHFTYALRPRIIPAERAISEGNEVPLLTKEEGDEEPNHFVHPMITRKPIFMGGRKGFVYIFHGAKGPNGEKGKIIGYVLHLRSSDTINKLPNGPDDIFKGLQQADLDLKRKPSKCAGCKSSDLSVC